MCIVLYEGHFCPWGEGLVALTDGTSGHVKAYARTHARTYMYIFFHPVSPYTVVQPEVTLEENGSKIVRCFADIIWSKASLTVPKGEVFHRLFTKQCKKRYSIKYGWPHFSRQRQNFQLKKKRERKKWRHTA